MHPQQLFELLAATTWRAILRANRNAIIYGKDATTSVNLNAIASANLASVAIEGARIDESHRGCRRAAGWRASLLLQCHGRRQAIDLIDLWHAQLMKQTSRVRRDRL